MIKGLSGQIVVGLDIGTSKVCAMIAAPDADFQYLNILGIGVSESSGLRRGVVVNIDKTVESIRQAIAKAEQQSGLKAEEVIVGIAGDHIQSFATRNIISIPSPTKEISRKDVSRLIEESRKIAMSSDRRILHMIPQEYIVDGQDGVTDPIGMSGVRMEANIHVVTGLITAIQNIQRCVERAGLYMKDIVLEPLASSTSVLDADEKEVGAALIDIGAGTTDVAVFTDNIIRYTSVFGIGGQHVTDDISKVLGVIHVQAEEAKRKYAHCYMPAILNDEQFYIPGAAGRMPKELSKSILCEIVQPRMEEIFEFAYAEIRKSGFINNLSAGVVITGGTSLLRGSVELAQEIMGLPVRLGLPSGIGFGGFSKEVENPIFATVVGLVLQGLKNDNEFGYQEIGGGNSTVGEIEEAPERVGTVSKLKQRVKKFFNEL